MRLEKLLEVIEESISLLEGEIEDRGMDKLLSDRFDLMAVLHSLQVSSQALIDMGAHLASETGEGVPSSYSEVPGLLQRLGVLSDEESALFRRIVGFRNVIVHQYTGADLEVVRRILEGDYRNILHLALKIIKWAEERGLDP